MEVDYDWGYNFFIVFWVFVINLVFYSSFGLWLFDYGDVKGEVVSYNKFESFVNDGWFFFGVVVVCGFEDVGDERSVFKVVVNEFFEVFVNVFVKVFRESFGWDIFLVNIKVFCVDVKFNRFLIS